MIPHGSVQLYNTGQAHSLALGAYKGGGILLRNPTTQQYQMFESPAAIAITGISNNGSGAVRVTLAANNRTFHAGERVWVNDPSLLPWLWGDWIAVPINSNQIDLLGSSFQAGYPGPGGAAILLGSVVGNMNAVRINGQANQVSSNNVVYSIFLRYADASCTWAELSLTTSGHSLPLLSGPGFEIDNIGDNGTFVGYGTKRDINTGGFTWQGDGHHQLIVGRYNPRWQTLFKEIGGSVQSTTWTKFNGPNPSGDIGYLTFADEYGGESAAELSIDVAQNFVSPQYGYVGIGVNGFDPGGPGVAPVQRYAVPHVAAAAPPPVSSSAWFGDTSSGNKTMPLGVPVNNNITAGWNQFDIYGKSQGPTPNTLRNGVIGTSFIRTRVQF